MSVVIPETEITIKKQTYKLCFDFAAIEQAEEQLGLSILANHVSVLFANKTPRIDVVRTMFYAALKHSQPKMTFDEVKKLVNGSNFVRIWVATNKCFIDGMGQPDPDEIEEEQVLPEPSAQN